MITTPAEFDPRSASQVLRLRLRDWMWPTALAVAVVIPILGHSSGTYRIGSLTYYANVYGPPLFVALLVFAGVRWCSIGRARALGPRPTRGRLPTSRLLLDVPGLLVAGFALWIVAMVVLGMLGIVDLD